MSPSPIIFDTMAGRPRLGIERHPFFLYKKTWLILKDLENRSAHTDNKKKMVQFAHEAIEQYANNNAVFKEEKNRGEKHA